MKKIKLLLGCLVAVTFVLPFVTLAADNELKFDVKMVRERFDYRYELLDGGSDPAEYFYDRFDFRWEVSKGDVLFHAEHRFTDNIMGADNNPQQSKASRDGYNYFMRNYYIQWSPESLAEKGFTLKVGKGGTGFGQQVNNDNDDSAARGTIETTFNVGKGKAIVAYARYFEGDTVDKVEGDENSARVQIDLPLGESGFNLGAYAAFYTKSDMILQQVDAATGIPEVKGDGTAFVGSVGLSGKLSSLDFYSEAGFATGKEDRLGTNAAVEYDLSGFYALVGGSIPAGNVTLGFEGAYGSGDDNTSDTDVKDFLTPHETDHCVGEVLQDEGVCGVANGGCGLSNVTYGLVSAEVSPTEKLTILGGLLYIKPTEKVVSSVTSKEVDSYGFELFWNVAYKLSDYLTYKLMGGYAFVNEDFLEDNPYQVWNRLEFQL
jgi:hypothetical protein